MGMERWEILSAWASLERMRRRRRSSMPLHLGHLRSFFFSFSLPRSPGLVWSVRDSFLSASRPSVRLPEPLACAVWKVAGRAVLHKALDGGRQSPPGSSSWLAALPWLVGWLVGQVGWLSFATLRFVSSEALLSLTLGCQPSEIRGCVADAWRRLLLLQQCQFGSGQEAY